MMFMNNSMLTEEDQLVAELRHLGITYLSNRQIDSLRNERTPERLLADAVCQPSSRVRTAVIGLFLLHPDFFKYIALASKYLNANQYLLLKLFYTASVYLQRLYQNELVPIVGPNWEWLPDLYGEELGIASGLLPQEAINLIGLRHKELTRTFTNWSGTYKNAVDHLIRYKQLESLWNR